MKVLIMSHNPITDYNSMGKTILSLFSEFSQDELCQLYIFPSLPNINRCHSYYRITDKEAFISIYQRRNAGRKITDSEIHPHNTLYEKYDATNRYYQKNSNKELKILIRDLLWKFSTWNNNELSSWLKAEKPDIIFAAPGASGFFYRVIEQTAESLNIPIVTYICDDFYFSNQLRTGIIQQYYARYIRCKIKPHLLKSAHVVTICDELARDYAREFGCSCTTISTGANIPLAASAPLTSGASISYFGNLQIGRHESLATVARMIDKYNAECGKDVTFNIYTRDDTPQTRTAFAGIRCVQFGAFLSADKMYEKMSHSSLLIHVESFEKENTERVKYSVSTKIADSLSSGICLFAYGPAGIASMEYLKKNNCAYTAFNEQELREKLFACLDNATGRQAMAEQALRTAAENHQAKKQSQLLRAVLAKVKA